MRNLSLKQLEAVGAIARSGTLTKAAQALSVTPAALTARLKQLEDEVGLALFDRTRSGLRITGAGRELLWAIDSIDVILDSCIERLHARRGLVGGRISVGVVSTAKYFAPTAIARFVRAHPALEISLVVGNRESTIDAMRNFDIDLAIMGRPPRDFAIEAEVLGDHPLVVIAAPGHRLGGRRNLSRAELAEEAFLVREPGSGTRTVFEEFMAGLVIRRAKLGIDAGSNETIKQAVMAGLGIALISAHTVAAEVESGRIIVLDVDGLPIRRQWFVVRRADKTVSPAAAAFWAFLGADSATWLPRLPDQ